MTFPKSITNTRENFRIGFFLICLYSSVQNKLNIVALNLRQMRMCVCVWGGHHHLFRLLHLLTECILKLLSINLDLRLNLQQASKNKNTKKNPD